MSPTRFLHLTTFPKHLTGVLLRFSQGFSRCFSAFLDFRGLLLDYLGLDFGKDGGPSLSQSHTHTLICIRCCIYLSPSAKWYYWFYIHVNRRLFSKFNFSLSVSFTRSQSMKGFVASNIRHIIVLDFALIG